MQPNKKNKIDKLKERLYSPKSKGLSLKPRATIYEDPHNTSDEWQKDVTQPKKSKERKSLLANTIFRKFFIGAVLFFVLAIIFGLVMYFKGANTVSADNIDIEVLGNAFVSGGDELPLKIQMINRNNVSLEFCDLILQYQKGAGNGENIQSDRVTIGTIPAGGMVEKLTNITLFGSQGTTRDVNITLEYRVKGSSAIFVKQKPYVVNISSTPINLVVDGPKVTNSNQNISFNITSSLNTENTAKGMLVSVHYPPGFDFKSASPEPTFSNNVWSLGDLSKGAEKNITINGVIVADEGEQRAFNITVGGKDPENEQKIGTQFNAQDYIISIEKPFLDLKFAINGDYNTEVSAQSSQLTQGEIKLTNTLDTKMTDIEISAKFSGNAFDPNNIQQDGGFYDSTTQTITWNSQTNKYLKSFDPGDGQTLTFRFKPIAFSNLKNPQVNIDISVKGRQPSLGDLFQSIDSYVKKQVKFGSSLAITGNALYYSGPFINTGPIPPTPGTPTTYTIVWNIANTINKVTDTKVTASLPIYVDWVGKFSPSDASVTYNAITKQITWNAGSIDAGVGVTSSPKQLYFQVRLNPSGSQSGSTPDILFDTIMKAKDSFTNSDLNMSIQPINTRLNFDSNYNQQNDKVQ
jgi:hypothetical protein